MDACALGCRILPGHLTEAHSTRLWHQTIMSPGDSWMICVRDVVKRGIFGYYAARIRDIPFTRARVMAAYTPVVAASFEPIIQGSVGSLSELASFP